MLSSCTRKPLDLEFEISLLIFETFPSRYLKQSGRLCLSKVRVLRYWILQRSVWIPKLHYRADNSPLPASILSQVSPLAALLSHFFKIPFSIILPSTSRSSDCYLSFRFSPPSSVSISLLFQTDSNAVIKFRVL